MSAMKLVESNNAVAVVEDDMITVKVGADEVQMPANFTDAEIRTQLAPLYPFIRNASVEVRDGVREYFVEQGEKG